MAICNKLVRDKIPEIIENAGKAYEIKTLENKDYIISLNKKLQEELEEYYFENDITELADLVEVVYAIIRYKGLSIEEFEKIRLGKRDKRGGFDKRLFLIGVSE